MRKVEEANDSQVSILIQDTKEQSHGCISCVEVPNMKTERFVSIKNVSEGMKVNHIHTLSPLFVP